MNGKACPFKRVHASQHIMLDRVEVIDGLLSIDFMISDDNILTKAFSS